MEHIEGVYGKDRSVEVNDIGTTHEGRTIHEVIVRPYSKLIVRIPVVSMYDWDIIEIFNVHKLLASISYNHVSNITFFI